MSHWSDTPCIRGAGKPDGNGYLRQMRNGVTHRQHRWAYIDAYGEPAPGHSFSGENLALRREGRLRVCRACRKKWNADQYQRRKASLTSVR